MLPGISPELILFGEELARNRKTKDGLRQMVEPEHHYFSIDVAPGPRVLSKVRSSRSKPILILVAPSRPVP